MRAIKSVRTINYGNGNVLKPYDLLVVDRGRVKTVTFSCHVFDHNIILYTRIAGVTNRRPGSQPLYVVIIFVYQNRVKLRRRCLMYYYIIYNLFSNMRTRYMKSYLK